jgi:MFS family permease
MRSGRRRRRDAVTPRPAYPLRVPRHARPRPMAAALGSRGGGSSPRAAPGSALGHRRSLALIALAVLLAMTTWFSATAVLPQLRLAWSLTTAQEAFLTVAVQLGFVAGALVSAFFNLTDIMHARTLMLLGALGAAGANIQLIWIHSAVPAIVCRFLTGAFLAGVYPSGLKVMSGWFRADRGTALGVLVGALTLGSAAPQFLNGVGGANWRVVIATTSALAVAGGLTARYLVADGPFGLPKASFALGKLHSFFVTVLSGWRSRAIWGTRGRFTPCGPGYSPLPGRRSS